MLATLVLATLVAAGPPITLRLSNDGRYQPGDAVQVSVRPAADGYLLVLHADPDGRLRVLFPLDPTDDAFVRGGRDYELRSRGDRRDLFIADWNRGQGTILAALSSGPLQTDAFSLNGHWDYRALNLDQSLDDESALRDIASRMAPAGMQYDVVPYVIGEAGSNGYATGDGVSYVAVGVGGCWSCGVGWVDPWWGWGWGAPGWGWGWGVPGWGWGWGVSVGWGWGAPGWGWGAPGWGWGAPGWGGGAPGWGGGWAGNTYPSRTWGGQPHPGGGVGVQGDNRFTQTLASSGAASGYRGRGASNNVGVQASFSRPSGAYNGRRTEAGALASGTGGGRRTEAGALASGTGGGRRTEAGAVASSAGNGRSVTRNGGRRAEAAGTVAPRDVSRGYTGADAPRNVSYDRGAVRRTNGSQALPRDSRIDANGTYARSSTESNGRRSNGGQVSGNASSSYERNRPQGTYDRGGSAYQSRSGSASGNSGRGYSAPSGGGGSRSYSGGGGGGGSRGYSGGGGGGGSRGFSGGGGGGGGSRGGGGGGGYRGR
jgi:hypothetical protein